MVKNIKVQYTASSLKDLRKLEKNQAKKIVLVIQKYTAKKPLEKAKSLGGIFAGLYRYRIGDYRVIFEYNDKNILIIITILRIKHRKDIYRK